MRQIHWRSLVATKQISDLESEDLLGSQYFQSNLLKLSPAKWSSELFSLLESRCFQTAGCGRDGSHCSGKQKERMATCHPHNLILVGEFECYWRLWIRRVEGQRWWDWWPSPLFSGLSQNPSKRFLAMHAYLIIVSKQCFTILESHIITVSYILEKEIDILTGNLLNKVKIFIFLCNI